MATKKEPKSAEKQKPAIQINRSRGGGKKKPDLFARLRDTSHPLDNLMPLDIEFNPKESDVQESAELGAQDIDQLDAQENILDVQHISNSDAQLSETRTPNKPLIGHPNEENLDAQSVETRAPKPIKIGRPVEENLDVLTPKTENRTPKSTTALDAKTSNIQNLDAQAPKEIEKRRVWENNRATDRVSLRPNADILRKFKVFCAEKDLGLTEFFEISGLKFLELDAQVAQELDVLTPLDDRRLKMLFKSKAFIINLYLRYNSIFNELAAGGGKKWSARWSPRDDEAAVRYNEVLPAIIELGILQTQIQKGIGSSRIQTFKYYTDEIEKVLASGVSDEMLDTILKYHRQLWKNQTGRELDLSFLDGESNRK